MIILSSQLSAIQAAAAAGDVDAQALLKELGPLMKQAFGEDEESLLDKKVEKTGIGSIGRYAWCGK